MLKRVVIPRHLMPYLLLMIIAIIAYWQVAFFVSAFKWDILDGYLPFRYFVSECIQNNHYPFWNPYLQCGYPIHANLISCWYPEITWISAIFGYSNLTLHVSFILYIFLAGAGMYKLSFYLYNKKWISFILAVSYMLSGFFVGHGQHMNFIVGAAWMPFALLFCIKFFNTPSYSALLKCFIVLFLMLTGGYPALSIILLYFLPVLFLYYSYNICLRQHDYKKFRFLVLMCVLLFALTFISLSGLTLAFYQVKPYIARFSGMPLESIQLNPFSPQSSISFLFPFSTIEHSEFFGTDVSMNNAYFGLFALIFFIYGAFRIKHNLIRIFLFFGIFAFLASLGSFLPVRALLYEYFPLMDKFKYPAVFRIYVILCFLIVAGNGLSKITRQQLKEKRFIVIPASVFMVIILIFAYAFFKINYEDITSLSWEAIKNNIFFRLLFQGCIQLLFLSLFVIIIWHKKLDFKKPLILLVTIDLLLCVQLNINKTVISKNNPVELYRWIQSQPKGFPLPDPANTISRNTSSTFSYGPLWKNTAIFSKRVSPDSYQPGFMFKNWYLLLRSYPNLLESSLNNPLIYLTDKVYSLNGLSDTLNPSAHHKNVYLSQQTINKIDGNTLSSAKGDTIIITDFSPSEIKATVKTKNRQFLNLLQSNYKGWSVYIDGKKTNHYTTNYIFMGTIVPPGVHEVIFKYQNPFVLTGFFIGNAIFIASIILLLMISYKNKKIKPIHFWLCIIMMATLFCMGVFNIKTPYKKKRAKVYNEIAEKLSAIKNKYHADSITYLVNADNYPLIEPVLENSKSFNCRVKHPEDMARIINISSNTETPVMVYIWSNVSEPDEVEDIIQYNFGDVLQQINNDDYKIIVYKKGNSVIENKENIYHKKLITWDTGLYQTDTSIVYEGTNSCLINENKKYLSLANHVFLDKGFKYPIKASASVQTNFLSRQEAFLVITIEKNGVKLFYKSIPIHRLNDKTNKWKNIIISGKYEVTGGEMLKCYIWNKNGATLLIDDVIINITPVSNDT